MKVEGVGVGREDVVHQIANYCKFLFYTGMLTYITILVHF